MPGSQRWKMRSKAYDLRSYTFKPGDEILVDANIWLYLFPAPVNAQSPFVSQYSNGFSRMIQDGAKPVLDPLILSEYLNRYCRIEWAGQYKEIYPDFKLFRKTSVFREIAAVAAYFARRILTMCLVHPTPVNTVNINKAIDDFESGDLDFNDSLVADICRQRNFKLLTNDADFQACGIEVLTTNPRLLQG